MKPNIVVLTEEEIRRCTPAGDEAGFGALSCERGALPLRAMSVHARLDGLLASLDVRQTFVNAFDEPIEATYIFPLPDRAAVTGFRMEVGGRIIDGLLKERGQARHDYDEAMKAGHRASIAEEERPNVFTLRVGNLMPRESATVHLTLAGPLVYDDGEATFRFPLVVAPRYIPGVPLPGPSVGAGTALDTDAVPDASRITPPVLLPGFPNSVQLEFVVDYSGPLPADGFHSSLHALVSEPEGVSGWRLSMQPGERLNRDFILRYRLAADAVRPSLVLHADREGRDGTFVLTVLPPAGSGGVGRPRDVVFVLDRSGSMAGWKMVAARRALGRMIDMLAPRDRFTVYAFDDRIETPPEAAGQKLMPATDRQRFRAIEFLARIEARGGTEMARPLDEAVRQLGTASERDRVLVLVTDGQVGNEDQILRTLGQRLAGIRVFTLGVDRAVNEGFLKRFAAVGGGSCDLVESEDRLDAVMDKVQRRIGEPILTEMSLEPNGLSIDADSMTPSRLPDLFAGSPLVVMGRYHGTPTGTLRVAGRDDAGRPWQQAIAAERRDHAAAAPLWARRRLRALEDQYAIGERDPQAAAKRIVELSLRFGVLCRFTAFVAVDRSEVVNAGGRQHSIVQPVEAPSGWGMFGAVGAAGGAVLSACAPAAAPQMRGEGFVSDYDAQKLSPPKRKLARNLFRATPPSPKPSAAKDALGHAIELTAYRRQAQDLLVRLTAPATDRLRALGVLAVRLTALIDDLRSVGVSTDILRPLQDLLDALNQLGPTPTDADLQRAWSMAQAVLKAFAEANAAGAAARPAEFWK